MTASILSFLSILILVPSSRDFFFPDVVVSPFQSDPPSDRPPNPAVVVEGQGPASQTSKSTSSRHEDEEKQAVSFVDTIDDLIKSGSKGKTEMDEDDEDEDEPAPSESKKDEKQRKKEEKKRRKKEQKKQRQDKLAKHGKPIMVIAGEPHQLHRSALIKPSCSCSFRPSIRDLTYVYSIRQVTWRTDGNAGQSGPVSWSLAPLHR